MAQPIRKADILPLDQRDSEQRQARSLGAFLSHYERRNPVARAAVWGIFIAIVGMSLDYLLWRVHWSWIQEHVALNLLQGAVCGLAIWAFLRARDDRMQRRFKEVGYLNHHIRNSLAAINLAEGSVEERGQRLEMVTKATTRIQRCVEKISREEDCEIDDQSLQEP